MAAQPAGKVEALEHFLHNFYIMGSHIHFFLYKKPGEGPSSKSFLFLDNCMFLVPKVFLFSFLIFLVKNGLLISIKVASSEFLKF